MGCEQLRSRRELLPQQRCAVPSGPRGRIVAATVFYVRRGVAPQACGLGNSREEAGEGEVGGRAGEAGIELLRDIRDIFEANRENRLATFDILEKLNSSDGPWAGWFHGRGLNAHSLARLLRPFNVYPRDIRFAHGTQKGYLSADFEGPWALYLSSEAGEGQQGQQAAIYAGSSGFLEGQQTPSVASQEMENRQ